MSISSDAFVVGSVWTVANSQCISITDKIQGQLDYLTKLSTKVQTSLHKAKNNGPKRLEVICYQDHIHKSKGISTAEETCGYHVFANVFSNKTSACITSCAMSHKCIIPGFYKGSTSVPGFGTPKNSPGNRENIY
jgi:hypothetical protein